MSLGYGKLLLEPPKLLSTLKHPEITLPFQLHLTTIEQFNAFFAPLHQITHTFFYLLRTSFHLQSRASKFVGTTLIVDTLFITMQYMDSGCLKQM